MSENQIDINAKDGVMSITAKIIEKQENKTANSYSSSSSMRMYQQSIPLPADADAGSISAEYKDGKLVISIKKLKNIKPQSNIRINGTSVTPLKTQEQKTTEQNSTDSNVTNTSEQNDTKEKKDKMIVEDNITVS